MLANKLMGAAGGSGSSSDPNFSNVSLLLHGDGTNGAQNNTFIDSSSNNFTITRNGNTTQGTFSPFSKEAGKWGVAFDGTGDYFKVASNAAFGYGTGDFTIEFWFNAASGTGDGYVIDHGTAGNVGCVEIMGTRVQYYNTSSGVIRADGVVTPGKWQHCAVVRYSGTTSIYVDGVRPTGAYWTDSYNYPTQALTIGAYSLDNTYAFNGQISNLRIVKGTALYTANFTPSTTPLTAVAGTSLLCCQDNRFKDNSSNNFTLTPYGDTKVTPFSPFANSAAYSASVNGGSGYFDGTGDYLGIADNSAFTLSTGNFTFECWVNLNIQTLDASYWHILAGQWQGQSNTDSSIAFGVNGSSGTDGRLYFAYGTSGGGYNIFSTATTMYKDNQWHHLAAVRNGVTITFYVDGVSQGTSTIGATSINDSSLPFKVGGYVNGGANAYNVTGYLTDIRLLKGTALYTANFTPPTTPLTAVTNTQLLLNFTNVGIIDNSGMNDLETVGNAQISTAVKKFGTGAMYFDGISKCLAKGTNKPIAANEDFTVECWAYPVATGSLYCIATPRPGSGNWFFGIYQGNIFAYDEAISTFSGTTVTTNTWSHLAYSRQGTTHRLFINGILAGSMTATAQAHPSVDISVGSDNSGSTGTASAFNGYIDDLRITKGVARYTANFTVPSSAFPDK